MLLLFFFKYRMFENGEVFCLTYWKMGQKTSKYQYCDNDESRHSMILADEFDFSHMNIEQWHIGDENGVITQDYKNDWLLCVRQRDQKVISEPDQRFQALYFIR